MTVESMTVESLTEQAKRICINKGVRFTAIREKVFRLMAETQTGMGAYDLLDKLKETEPNAKPATIYRALDFLSELGFIHKIESSNAFMLCHHFDHSHPVQLFICDNCGHVDELHDHTIPSEFKALAKKLGFQIKSQTVEAHGLCLKCS